MEKSILTSAGDALETAAKKAAKTFEKMVDEAKARIPHELDMDTVVRPCDANIRPVYPVRYAYMNFFGDTWIDAQLPPSISTFIDPDDDSLSASVLGGYSIRMPRPGWIYVKEEGPIKTRGSQQGGKLLIFKFSPEIVTLEGKRGMVTKYTKYEQKAGSSSWEEIHPASGTAGLGYPFLAIDKDVTQISLVYSEVELAKSVLNKMDNDKNFRKSAMQFVDLDSEVSDYAIDARQEHFDGLVEDFKDPEKQFQAYKNQLSDPLLHAADLGDITTEGSFFMDAEMEMRYIDSLICPYYKDKAKIVVLHDPVGYQRDILMAYELLSAWQINYVATYMHPISIGQFVEQMEMSKDEKIKKYLKDCIHQENWKTWWPKLNTPISETTEKLKETVSLYKSFFEKNSISDQRGGLAHYFKYFFSVTKKKDVITERDAEEFRVFCTLFAELIGPLLNSEIGIREVEQLLGGVQASESSSTWDVVRNGIVNTLGHAGADKTLVAKNLAQGVDTLLEAIGPILGKFYVFLAEKTHKKALDLHIKSIEKITQVLIPKCLAIWGIRIEKGQYVTLTEKDFYNFLKQIEPKEQSEYLKKAADKIKSHVQKAGIKKVFDWAKCIDNYTGRQKIKMSAIHYEQPKFNTGIKFFQHNNKYISHLLDSSLVGLDLFMKAYTLNTLLAQSSFDNNSPFGTNRLPMYFAGTFMNTILGGLIAVRGTSNLIGRAMISAGALVPKLGSPAARAFVGKASSKMLLNSANMVTFTRLGIGTSGVASAILSYTDAVNAFGLGNRGEGYSHISIGSGTLLMTLAYGYAAVTTASTTTGVVAGAATMEAAAVTLTGAALAFFWVGVFIVILGILYLLIFSKDEFENLLQNCFWGNGEKYAFWSRDDPRPEKIEVQFERIIEMSNEISNATKVEYQEFANLFMAPTLKREFKDKKAIYRFTLPSFQWGKSEIFYQVIPSTLSALAVGSPYAPAAPNVVASNISIRQSAKNNFEELMKAGYEKLTDEGGLTTLTVEMDSLEASHSKIFWYYMPTESVISPLRYVWSKEPILENAIYGYDDEVLRG
ncbi:hypothetical protein PSI22_11760 [Xenorhabdus sp. XENO-7]|uniref:Toxin VasX N-terminal region domain-containing protein n=1 Tax=Xenorhabdus aichiensis TaxID=3025874 RepID=A0ABT5M5I2_9GAMM|nr:toxin VasX [Xenorhabdus aichiensis]MDC9622290.1 hypothetical protein [Xenorhabdus aichiensis]